MPLTLSCAFATSNESHEHARIAEELGYARAWFYDSPALYPDVWVQLCRAAERTTRIGLGPGVRVPHVAGHGHGDGGDAHERDGPKVRSSGEGVHAPASPRAWTSRFMIRT